MASMKNLGALRIVSKARLNSELTIGKLLIKLLIDMIQNNCGLVFESIGYVLPAGEL